VSRARRAATRPPNAAVSLDECLQVYNEDLDELTPSELVSEIYRAARIVARDPRAIVWRGVTPITAQRYADERIELCEARLRKLRRKARESTW
jgi:hypothetical protein